jgi:hypothetical protein
MKRNIEPLICYPTSRIHCAHSISNPKSRVVENNVFCFLRWLSWIILILYVVLKLKKRSVVDMKFTCMNVADVKHKRGRGLSPSQFLGNCLGFGNQSVDQCFRLGHFVTIDIQATNDVTECGLSADGFDVSHL